MVEEISGLAERAPVNGITRETWLMVACFFGGAAAIAASHHPLLVGFKTEVGLVVQSVVFLGALMVGDHLGSWGRYVGPIAEVIARTERERPGASSVEKLRYAVTLLPGVARQWNFGLVSTFVLWWKGKAWIHKAAPVLGDLIGMEPGGGVPPDSRLKKK